MSTEAELFDDETLVAYLDGELSEEQASRVRESIGRDPLLKRRVEELQASWNLLDQLPTANPNPQLAQSTIELITQGIVKSDKSNLFTWLKRNRWLAIAGLSLVTVSIGFWLSTQNQRNFQQAVVEDLFVLAHFRELDNIDSEAWLEKLASITELERAGLPLYNASSFPTLPAKRKELRGWIENLDTPQKQVLQSAYRTFHASDKERQASLRSMAQQLKSADSEKTFNLIKAYSALMNKIGTTEAIQIKGEEDLNKRVDELQIIVRRELAISYPLSDEEKSHIVDWCDQLKAGNLFFLNAEDPDGEIIRLLDIESSDSNIQAEDVERLMQCVDQRGQELLKSLATSLQTKILKLWIVNSLPNIQPRAQYSSAELLDRFKRLPTQAQNELIYLPGTDVIKALSRDSSTESEASVDGK